MAVSQSQPQTRLVNRVARFTGNGTWTVPAGVTYAIAYMVGGGGGVGTNTSGGNGSNSSVAFASGTVTGPGASKTIMGSAVGNKIAGIANLGENASGFDTPGGDRGGLAGAAKNLYVVAGAAVTPGASISVTVGAGGVAGTSGSAGGSGYVYIEYEQEVFV